MANEDSVDCYEFRLNGRDYQMTEEDFLEARDNLFKRIKPYADTLSKSYKANLKVHEEYLETAQLKEGYLKAVSLVVSLRFGSIKLPNASLATKAGSAVSSLERAVSSKRIMDLGPALEAAETALNAYQDDMMRFLKELGASAYTTGTVLSATAAVGFAVVGAMAASVFVAGGLSAGAAAAASAAGVKALQSATEQFANAALGQEVSVWESVQKVVIDAAVAGATAGVMSKIPTDLFKPMATSAAGKIASKLTYLSSKEVQTFVIKYLEGSGMALVTSAASEAVDALTKMVQSGKTPTEKDLIDAFEKVLLATLTGGFLKNLEASEKKAIYAIKDHLEIKVLPDMIAKAVSGSPPGKTEQVKIVADILKTGLEEAGKSGMKGALDVVRGDGSPDQFATEAVKVVDRDTALRRLLEAEVKAVLKKRKIPVK